MQQNTRNVQSNIMCTYSRLRASKEVFETHHMYLLMVTCNKINELTCSVHNRGVMSWTLYFSIISYILCYVIVRHLT